MLHPFGRPPLRWSLGGTMHLARSGTLPAALERQLLAVERRRSLTVQQQQYRATHRAHPPSRLSRRPPG